MGIFLHLGIPEHGIMIGDSQCIESFLAGSVDQPVGIIGDIIFGILSRMRVKIDLQFLQLKASFTLAPISAGLLAT